jgi:XRE family transcriptional regulator of biofilm formation
VSDHIGHRIQKIRKLKGISLSELAEKSNVAKSYISNVERNIQNNPSIQLIEKIANALDVTMNTILYGDQADLENELDPDWLQLAQEAMASGISKNQFKEYLEFQKWRLSQGTARSDSTDEKIEKEET